MRTFLHIYLLFIFSLVLVSCSKPEPLKNKPGDLPNSPVNLEYFNTVYDDYNSTAPILGRLIPFCFSTNRDSHGQEFDVIYKPMNVCFERSSGILTVTDEYTSWEIYIDDYEVIKKAINKIRTVGNELGPNLIIGYEFNTLYFTLLYASDFSGDFQINFTSNKSNPDFSEIKPVTFLNSNFDDLYPAINSTKDRIYFCSNRDGNHFDIYYSEISIAEPDLEIILSDTNQHVIIKDTVISSTFDDKCPFIFDNVLVFTSDKPGGFGGFDLYYSVFENNQWSKPINFGSTINSEFDEYRPILLQEGVSEKEIMMVFSSNRPGGKGGFDLYFVGVETK